MSRRLTIALALGLATITAGCTTVSDANAVARVGDVELTRDDFRAELTAAGADPATALGADITRAVLTTWIHEQVAAMPVDEDALAVAYDAGMHTSGSMCIAAIVVADESTATDVKADIDGGTSFDEAFAASNIDQQIAASTGRLPCITAGDIAGSEDVPFIATAMNLHAGEPVATAPLVDQAGTEIAWVVIRLRPFADLTESEVNAISGAFLGEGLDVHVDPRYGVYDRATSQVIALG